MADDNQPRKRTQTQVYDVLRDGRNGTAIKRQAAEQVQDGRPRTVQVAAAVDSGARRHSRNVMALAPRGKGLAGATPTGPPCMRSDRCGEVHWTAVSSSGVEFGCGALMSFELPRDFAIGEPLDDLIPSDWPTFIAYGVVSTGVYVSEDGGDYVIDVNEWLGGVHLLVRVRRAALC